MLLPRRVIRSGVALGALLLGCMAPVSAQAAALTPVFMPRPAHVVLNGQSLVLSAMPDIYWAQPPSPLLKRALARFRARLKEAGVRSAQHPCMTLTIHVGHDPDYLSLEAREAYRLEVRPTGIVLSADGPAGIIHGFATLLQMLDTHGATPMLLQGDITDAPRFRWRGLMFDVSRHFQSLETIKRQLDAMELTKLNVMHWHLSDGTGFRVESRYLPRLQQKGGHGAYYTQAQVKEIIAYAADRGIRVVPEFDIPGHALAILTAYPDLAAQPSVMMRKERSPECQVVSHQGETTTRCEKYPNLNIPALDPTNPKVLAFTRILFAEMGALFPDRYFHAGGDEVVASQWTDNPQIAAYMKAHGYHDAPAIQAAFTAEVAKILAADSKIMMGWDEVSEAPIPKNVVVEAWRGSKWVGRATRLGHPVVVSSGYYLDLLNPARQHYAVDPFDTRADGLNPTQHGQVPSLLRETAFTLDPEAPPLDEVQKKRVLGGEAPLWTEIVSDEMVDARLWPRSAALAERYWSPQSIANPVDLEQRLPIVLNTLETFGLRASAHQARMIARLTPGNIAPLTQFVAITVPVRNYAMNLLARDKGDAILISPAAIAAPDSFEANAFNALAARYESGETDVVDDIRSRLARYAANDIAFQALPHQPVIDEVRPVSRQIAALSRLGLEAMRPGKKSRAWHERATSLLAEQTAFFAASADHDASKQSSQPPGGVLIAIVPGIKSLVATAQSR